MRLWEIYHESIPELIALLSSSPEMERLSDVGMNCGCEYTSFPIYRGLGSHSRLDHSVGVGLIVWHFTRSETQAAAGLFHDIATPVFAHVVDFLRGDYLTQEATEDGTLSAIVRSPVIMDQLKSAGIPAEDVGDYHRYPIADNDSPRLSADRLEYTLSNMVNFGFGTREAAREFYNDLCVGENEEGVPELMFKTGETALAFSTVALRLSRLYEAKEDRYAMEMLSELLGKALALGVLQEEELYTTEGQVIDKLLNDPRTRPLWIRYRSLSAVNAAPVPGEGALWRRIQVKRRYIDPAVFGAGRVSRLFPAHGEALRTYLNEDLREWLCGEFDRNG